MNFTALASPIAIPPGLSPLSCPMPSTAVEEVAQRRLRDSVRRPLSSLRCRVDGSTAHLTGRVHSFFLKQIAQETVRHVHGIDRIKNDVEVVGQK